MLTVTSLQTDTAIPWQTKLLHCHQVSIHRKHGQQRLLGPAKKQNNKNKKDHWFIRGEKHRLRIIGKSNLNSAFCHCNFENKNQFLYLSWGSSLQDVSTVSCEQWFLHRTLLTGGEITARRAFQPTTLTKWKERGNYTGRAMEGSLILWAPILTGMLFLLTQQ